MLFSLRPAQDETRNKGRTQEGGAPIEEQKKKSGREKCSPVISGGRYVLGGVLAEELFWCESLADDRGKRRKSDF